MCISACNGARQEVVVFISECNDAGQVGVCPECNGQLGGGMYPRIQYGMR